MSGVSVFGDLSVIPFAVGYLKPSYSAYSLMICFKYKNNLADGRLGQQILRYSKSLIQKALAILSVSQGLGFKAGFPGTACQGEQDNTAKLYIIQVCTKEKKAAGKLMKRHMEVPNGQRERRNRRC